MFVVVLQHRAEARAWARNPMGSNGPNGVLLSGVQQLVPSFFEATPRLSPCTTARPFSLTWPACSAIAQYVAPSLPLPADVPEPSVPRSSSSLRLILHRRTSRASTQFPFQRPG